MRRGANPLLLAVFAALLSATGCTVPPVGRVGVGVDADGNLVAYVAVCQPSDHIDAVLLDIQDSEGSRGLRVGEWQTTQPVTTFATFRLDDPKEPWSALQPLATLQTNRTYELWGGTQDDSGSALGTAFTVKDLRTLVPGTVRSVDHFDATGALLRNDSVDAFRARACDGVAR